MLAHEEYKRLIAAAEKRAHSRHEQAAINAAAQELKLYSSLGDSTVGKLRQIAGQTS